MALWTQEQEARVACSEPPFDANPAFTRLTDIMLTGSDDIYSTQDALLGACYSFPAAKTLYERCPVATDYHPQLNALTGAMSRIETLELRDSDGLDSYYCMHDFGAPERML
ncbi:hypothetical protein VF21_04925 [Pseudogymnoascus sp. 05NY08]|nr:hypothetical protein VF21_04925 [Pseudogymnoascus sp. 05NY08]